MPAIPIADSSAPIVVRDQRDEQRGSMWSRRIRGAGEQPERPASVTTTIMKISVRARRARDV